MSASSSRPPVDGYVDPSFPPPDGKWDTPVIIYGYTPALALAATAATWFFILLLAHSYLNVRHRSLYFLPFPVGLLFEVVGYVARALSAGKNPYHLLYFILNYFFVVTAPVFLAAGIYAILSALIPRLGRTHSFLPPKVVLWFFITSDVVATITQVAGAAIIGKRQSDRKDPKIGNDILLGGLAYQVFSMGVYVLLTASFLVRARRAIREHGRGLAVFCAVFAAATVLIYLRTCFRLAETAQGLGGKLQSSEIYFAFLEFLPVALAVALFAVWHPGKYLGARVNPRVQEKHAHMGA